MRGLFTKRHARTTIVIAVAAAACGIASALTTLLDGDTPIEVAYDQILHDRLVAERVGNLEDLADRLIEDQHLHLTLHPPAPDFIVSQSGGPIAVLDDESFAQSFINKLIGIQRNGITCFPIFMYEDATGPGRDLVIENAAGTRIAKIQREKGYSPDWFARLRHPQFDTYDQETRDHLTACYDPARIQMSYELVLGEEALVKMVWRESIVSAQAAAQGGGMGRMMSSSNVTEFTFIGIERSAGGLMELTIAWPQGELGTNMVDFFACTNLMVQNWQIVATTNVDLNTNTFTWIDTDYSNHCIRFYRCSPLTDSDGDGLSDGREVHLYGTEPDDPDTDNDGMPDGWELDNSFDPLDDSDAAGDADTDGLSNLQEYWNGADPWDIDSDDDTMPDGWEVNNGTDPLVGDAGQDPDGDELTNLAEYQNGTDPQDPDTDSDGLPDGWEVANSTNPLVDDAGSDPDTDGLTNAEEHSLGTDPQDDDSDNDGLTDGDEVNDYETDPLDEDSDEDGFTDYEEVIVFRSNPKLAGDLPPQYPQQSQTVYYGHTTPSSTNFVYSYSSALYDKVTMGKGWIVGNLFTPDLHVSSATVYYGQPDHNDCPNVFVHARTSTMWNDVRMGEGWITHQGFITDYSQASVTVYYGKPDESGHNDLFVYGTHGIDLSDEVEMGKGWVITDGFQPDLDEPPDQIWYTRPDKNNNPSNWVYTYDFRVGGWYDIGQGWLRANSPPSYIPDLTEPSAVVYYGLPGEAGSSDEFVCSYNNNMRDDVTLGQGWATPHGLLADLDSTPWPIYFGTVAGHPDEFVFARTTIGLENWTHVGQGWINMQDYVLSTEPSPDSDGDGQMDGYDPLSTEPWEEPDDSHTTPVLLEVGDVSTSHTEMYGLHVGDYALVMPHVNTQEFLFSGTFRIERGVFYEDSYLESLPDSDSDGDYYAMVSGAGIIVDDPDHVLVETNDSGFNSGKRYFDVYVPRVDVLAHKPGTLTSPGSAVSKIHENMAGGIVACVNDDNDDGGPSGSHDYDDTYVGSSDDDIVTLTLRQFLPDELEEGTLELTVEPSNTAVRIFKSASVVLGDYSMNLASPGGSDLAGMLSYDLDLYVEILEWHDEITIKLAYKNTSGVELCSDRVLLSPLRVNMKRPENLYPGDSVADGTVFHSYYKDGSPGVCGVECSVVAAPDTKEMRGFLEGKITWSIDSTQGSTLSWQNGATGAYNAVDDYWYEKAIYTGLPTNNSAFGEKTATYTISGLGCQGQGKAKVFFKAEAKNHPGEGSGSTPNWYYYWSQTGAGAGYTNSYGGSHPYYAGEMKYSSTEKRWVCIIYDGGTYITTRHNARTGTNYTYRSINRFAFTVRHEEKHRQQFIQMWGDGGGSENSPYNGIYDTDHDLMHDDIEATLAPGRPYSNTLFRTYLDEWNYGIGFKDSEDACMWEQQWPGQNEYDAVDWARPGRQYGYGYSEP